MRRAERTGKTLNFLSRSKKILNERKKEKKKLIVANLVTENPSRERADWWRGAKRKTALGDALDDDNSPRSNIDVCFGPGTNVHVDKETHSIAVQRAISARICGDVVWKAGTPRKGVALLLRSCLSNVAVRRSPLPDIFAGTANCALQRCRDAVRSLFRVRRIDFRRWPLGRVLYL